VLMGVLLPALANVRRNAHLATCAGNLRQIGLVLELYLGDNHQAYPDALFQTVIGQGAAQTNREITSDDLLHKYLGGPLSDAEMASPVSPKPLKIWICPEDDPESWYHYTARTYVPTQTRIMAPVPSAQPGTVKLFYGFAGSEASTTGAVQYRLSVKPSDIRRPSEFITFVEYPSDSNWQGGGLRSSCSGPDQQSWFMPRGRTLHRTTWNYLFADGHVATLAPTQTVSDKWAPLLQTTLATMKLYTGEAQPAKPPLIKTPIASAASLGEPATDRDVFWAGHWSGFTPPPPGALSPQQR